MSSASRSETLFEELDQQEIGVPVSDANAAVPTLTCDSHEHNDEPIREGEQIVLILVRNTDSGWTVQHTFCSHCQVLDEYSDMDSTGQATAVVEGIAVPENKRGSSEMMYLRDGFLWELNEDSA